MNREVDSLRMWLLNKCDEFRTKLDCSSYNDYEKMKILAKLEIISEIVSKLYENSIIESYMQKIDEKNLSTNTDAYMEEENCSKKAEKAMEQIKAYCNRFNDWCKPYDGDEKCIFDKGNFCILSDFSPKKYPPVDWEPPQEDEYE